MKSKEWLALKDHFSQLKRRHLRELFAADPERARSLTRRLDDFQVDFSRDRITPLTLKLLCDLARARRVPEWIGRLMSGDRVNNSEGRPALHWALRQPGPEPLLVEGRDVMPMVHNVLERMKSITRAVHQGQWRGFSGKPVQDVVHIGIGGSSLGPQMAVEALYAFRQGSLRFHFLANVDPAAVQGVLARVDAERALFIVASKTFTTLETLANAAEVKRWMLSRCPDSRSLSRHFIAVTAAADGAREFGIDPENILEMWDWVGGRFSLCSAVGLPVMLAVGEEHFESMLRGCHEMDRHFRQAPLESNLPVLLALVGIWYANFFGAATHAVLPYSHSLRTFPAYLQQLEMESCGKSVDRDGQPVRFATSPIVWGGSGTDAQHAFFQLLHQGRHLVPCDFIGFTRVPPEPGEQHRQLLANFYAQMEALAFGKTRSELRADKVPARLIPFKVFPGNRPSTAITAPSLTPFALGQLVALYEHKVFAQGVIWGLNPFDQWGVELGKALAKEIAGRLGRSGCNGPEPKL